MESDLTSTLPFLVIWNKKDQLAKEENRLLQSAQWIKQIDDISIGLLPYRTVFENTAQKEIAVFESDSTLIYIDGFYLSDSTKLFHYHEFKEGDPILSNKKVQFSNNYIEIDQQEDNKLLNISSSSLEVGTIYEASIWLSNNFKNRGQDDLNHLEFVVKEIAKNGKTIQSVRKVATSTFIHFEDWSLVQLEFSPLSKSSDIEFFIRGNSPG
ncbi:hypothetical protein N9515_04510 [Vicingaceae bacterium]|nr:hypothetical protein [Vicingaceae bacterium]